MFFINHIELGNETTALIEVKGKIDSNTSTEFEEYVQNIISQGIIFFLIDYSEVDFVSSEGIGMILFIEKLVSEKDGCIVAFNLSKEIVNLFQLLNFDKLFTIAQGRDEAIAILDRQLEMRSGNSKKISQEKEKIQTSATPVETPEKTEESLSQEETAQSTDNGLEPFVIKCVNCGKMIRIKEKGEHFCPECEASFSVAEQGKALFEEVKS